MLKMPQNVHHYWDHYYSPHVVAPFITTLTHWSLLSTRVSKSYVQNLLPNVCVRVCVCTHLPQQSATLVLFLGFDSFLSIELQEESH